MSKFASSKRALGVCDRCGFVYKLKELKFEMVKGVRNSLRVCSSCFDPDHPQLMLGRYPVSDPQALRDARPDVATFPASRAQIIPVYGVNAAVSVGNVTVTV